jgi:hypothetical protein
VLIRQALYLFSHTSSPPYCLIFFHFSIYFFPIFSFYLILGVAPHLTSHFITSVLLPPPPYILNSSVLESPNFLKKKIQIRKIVLQFAKLKMDGIYTYIYAGVCKDAYPRNYKYWCPSVVKGGFTIGNRDVLFFI